MTDDLPLADCRWCYNMRLSSLALDNNCTTKAQRSDRAQWPIEVMVCRHPMHDPDIYKNSAWVHCNHFMPVQKRAPK